MFRHPSCGKPPEIEWRACVEAKQAACFRTGGRTHHGCSHLGGGPQNLDHLTQEIPIMPELCGICSTDELSPDQKAGWARMRDALLQSGESQVENDERSWTAVAVVAHHRHDTATIIYPKGYASCALIGINTVVHGCSGSFKEFTMPDLNDDRFFTSFQPPFAVCLLDAKSRTARVIGDPYGLLPLYYACHAGVLVFCTKLGPLLKSGLVQWKLDPKAIIDFFTYEHLTGDRTLADTVHVLPPGTIVLFEHGRSHLQSYFPEVAENADWRTASSDAVADKLYYELSRSVAVSMADCSRVAITLSGGLDSRALLGCAVKHRPDLRTYTFGGPDCRDVQYARRLADICGVPHTTLDIDGSCLHQWLDHGVHVTGGMVSCTQYHILQLADVLDAEADVVLDGLGGDALTGGHLTWTMINTRSVDVAIYAVYNLRATGWATLEARCQLFENDFFEQTDYDPTNAVRKHFEHLTDRPVWWGCHRFDLLERQRRFIQFGPHQLRGLLDVRTPFYASRLVEFTKSLPAKYMLGQRSYRRMHIKHLPATAAVPDSTLGLPLSWPISVRFAKHAFDFVCRRLPEPMRHIIPGSNKSPTNYAVWFRTSLRSFIENRLCEPNSGLDGIIRQKEIKRIIHEHMSGVCDHTNKIGCLLTFHAWHESMKGSFRTPTKL